MSKTEIPRVYPDTELSEPMHETDPARLIDQAHQLQRQILERGIKMTTHDRPLTHSDGTVYGISTTVTADLDDGTFVIAASSRNVPEAEEKWKYSSMHVAVIERGEPMVWGLAQEADRRTVQAVNHEGRSTGVNSVDAVRAADHVFARATQLIQP